VQHDPPVPLLDPSQRVSDFVTSPEDRYIAGRTWASFCVRGGLSGILLWGTPDVGDVTQLLAAMPTEDSPVAQRRPRYFDARRLESVKDDALAAFARYFSNAERLAKILERVAVVHGGGLSQMLVAGFMSVTSIPYEVSLFPDPVVALTWLGHRAPARLAAELDELQAHAVGATPLIRDLHAVLAADLREVELAKVAKALGHSVRSLQRKLREEATSFQRELNACRVEAAKKLLVDTDQSVEAIAREVGATARHLGEVFRDHTGSTPRQWREANGKPGE
jgi:AraC-like DNA-binding protein